MDDIIILTCMHKRQDTVKYCFDQMPNIKKIVVYSLKEDGKFLEQFDNVVKYKYSNRPLSNKWNFGVSKLRNERFKGCIMLGSDDYVDQAFIDYVGNNIHKYDMIGFRDLYFESAGANYYWKGYTGKRYNEPAGAGKTYSKQFLKRLNYNLFPVAMDKSLDGLSWKQVKTVGSKIHITSLIKHNLMCCDVKDGKGLTDLSRITNIVKL